MFRTSVIGLTLLPLLLPFRSTPPAPAEDIEDPRGVIVYSATDEDAQVLISGGSELPIDRIRVISPDGSRVADARFEDPGDIGQADFGFDTPEPSLEDLTAAYPVGEYRFRGTAVDGTRLTGSFELSHELLDAPELVYPMEGDTGIPVSGLIAVWNPIEDAEAIRFEIENEEEETPLKVDLRGDATALQVPNDWLEPDTEYVLDVKAIAENGNITVSDVRFTTGD